MDFRHHCTLTPTFLSTQTNLGMLLKDAGVIFERADNSSINLVGNAKDMQKRGSIINPDWDFQKMGIGGLDQEFSAIFRRAFASRVFPPEIVQQLGNSLRAQHFFLTSRQFRNNLLRFVFQDASTSEVFCCSARRVRVRR